MQIWQNWSSKTKFNYRTSPWITMHKLRANLFLQKHIIWRMIPYHFNLYNNHGPKFSHNIHPNPLSLSLSRQQESFIQQCIKFDIIWPLWVDIEQTTQTIVEPPHKYYLILVAATSYVQTPIFIIRPNVTSFNESSHLYISSHMILERRHDKFWLITSDASLMHACLIPLIGTRSPSWCNSNQMLRN